MWSWFRKKIWLDKPSSWRDVSPNDSYDIEAMNAHVGMKVAAFFAAVQLKSQLVGSSPFNLYERKKDNSREIAYDEPLHRALHDLPNDETDAAQFWEGQALSLCIWGNAYSEKLSNRNGVIGLRKFPADDYEGMHDQHVEIKRTSSGLEYSFNDRGKTETLPERKVFHVRGFGTGGLYGLSPLAYARSTLSLARAAERAVGNQMKEGFRGKGFFVMPNGTELTDPQRKQTEKMLVDRYSGPNAKQVGVLEGGMTFLPINISAEDLELLAERRLTVEDICRFQGVPPIMIGHSSEGQTMWGSGVEQLLIQFYTTGLRPLFVRIEKAAYRSLLTPAQRTKFYVEANIDSLFRADSTARAALYQSYVNNGIRTRNEVRAYDNLPTMEGGDFLTVQSALVALQSLDPSSPSYRKPDQKDPGQQPQRQQPKLEVIK